jgi:hypothetical protein
VLVVGAALVVGALVVAGGVVVVLEQAVNVRPTTSRITNGTMSSFFKFILLKKRIPYYTLVHVIHMLYGFDRILRFSVIVIIIIIQKLVNNS